tara:strand:+ start:23 stop:388 length:366 start_codon:yes stop_codon:yes gene_type:complete
MKYEIEKNDLYYILIPKEEKIDSVLAPSLKADLVTYELEGAKNIILDLKNVKFMDSSGLSAMLVGNRIFREKNYSFIICNVSNHIEKVLKISKLDTVLNILPSLQESIDSIQLDEIEKGMN